MVKSNLSGLSKDMVAITLDKKAPPTEVIRSTLSSDVHFQAIWTKLSVVVKTATGNKREILSNFSGDAKSGEIIAVMGPSGAGKTTFLNCLAGSIKPTTGSITYYSKEKKASFAYVPQTDLLSPYLTVRESLLLSSKLKNSKKLESGQDHKELVTEFLERFSLERCANNLASKCSGGEAKRLSMALELISSPSFLLLDEPTSGLDSFTALKCIQSLRNGIDRSASNTKPLIMVIIHQPSSDLYNLFDKVYVLSQGTCIYEGVPIDTVEHLKAFGVTCPTYCNPADFILGIAADTENAALKDELKLSYLVQKEASNIQVDGSWKRVKPHKLKPSVSFIYSYFLLVKKLFKANLRDPQQSIFRLIEHLIFPLTLVTIVATRAPHSENVGCTFQAYNETHILPETFFERADRQKSSISNVTLLYFNIFGIFMAGLIPGILSFSSHLGVYMKERQNNWYSTGAFFWAFLTVSTSLTLLHATANSVAFMLLTGQEFTWTRFLFLSLANVLTAYLAESYSLMITSINMYHQLVSLIIGGSLAFVLQLFAGFLIRFSDSTTIGILISYLFPFRYLFSILVKVFYYSSTCFIGNDKIFTFSQVIEITDFFKHHGRRDLQPIRHVPDKIRASLEENVWSKAKILELAESMNDLDEQEVKNLDGLWYQSANYMYSEYGIENTSPWNDFLILAVMLFVHYIVAYCIITCKSRRRS